MNDKLEKLLDWFLDNPWVLTILVATALGVVNVIIDTRTDQAEIRVNISKR